MWLIYDDIKIPHLKGDFTLAIYTNYILTEFLINGIISALLTVVNVICIFITIIFLKIMKVATPIHPVPIKEGKDIFALLLSILQ